MEIRSMNQKNLLEVDWSKIPAPSDDGGAAHLAGIRIPPVSLLATDDNLVDLSALKGRTVVFAYPRTGVAAQVRCAVAQHNDTLRSPRWQRGCTCRFPCCQTRSWN